MAGLLAVSAPAPAQVGLGAERYEVTITPPKRPGTEAPVADANAAESVATDPDRTLGADAGVAGSPPPPQPPTPATATLPPATAGTPPAAAGPRATTSAPLRTLQVGAFRLKKSAELLRDELAATFQDVDVLEVSSGGEPLYRVHVGRQPRGPGLDDLKRRLVAAGHPAFEVPAPPLSAAR